MPFATTAQAQASDSLMLDTANRAARKPTSDQEDNYRSKPESTKELMVKLYYEGVLKAKPISMHAVVQDLNRALIENPASFMLYREGKSIRKFCAASIKPKYAGDPYPQPIPGTEHIVLRQKTFEVGAKCQPWSIDLGLFQKSFAIARRLSARTSLIGMVS